MSDEVELARHRIDMAVQISEMFGWPVDACWNVASRIQEAWMEAEREQGFAGTLAEIWELPEVTR